MRIPKPSVRMLALIGAAILSFPLTMSGQARDPQLAEILLGLVPDIDAMTGTGQAQNLPLAQILPDLILGEIVLESTAASNPTGISHVAHFSPLEAGELGSPVVGVVHGFNGQMATQFSTFPLGSSAGGLTYVFDPAVGTFQRSSTSFGPMFSERALTVGRRKLDVGFNYQYSSYHTFEGQHLDNGTIKFYLPHNDCCHFADPAHLTGFSLTPLNGHDRLNPPFKGDLVEAALSLKATAHTTALFANYGVTDRWDVGLAVPILRVNLDASVTARIIRLVTDARNAPPGTFTDQQIRDALNTHTFEINNPDATRTLRHTGHASGIGDIVLRTKYHFLSTEAGGLAAAVDLRLPTGDKDNLLGAGGVQAKFLLAASNERGRLGEHLNLGYTVAGGRVAGSFAGLTSAPLPDEINYSVGAEFVAAPRFTLIGDFVGRTLRGVGRLDLVSKSFEYNDPASITPGAPPGCGGFPGGVCRSAYFDELSPRPGHLTLLLGAGGAKFNLTGNLLLSGSVLFPLTTVGLRSPVTPVVGLDYAF